LVTYSIKNNFNCSLQVQKNIRVSPLPKASFTMDKNKICIKDKIFFNGTLAGTVANYIWNFGDSSTQTNSLTPMHTYLTSGVYTASLLVNDKFCGVDSMQKTITVLAYPKPSLGPDFTICSFEKATLYADTNAAYTYNWSTGETGTSIQHGGFTTTIYLAVKNDICTTKDTINIKVLPSCKVYMPTAFTPNRDNNNDVLYSLNSELATDYVMEVYNRYGQRIFYSTNPLMGWDGKYKGVDAPVGTYVWKLRFKERAAKDIISLKGTCVLIR
jgi:gliding motility-associated-like protein